MCNPTKKGGETSEVIPYSKKHGIKAREVRRSGVTWRMCSGKRRASGPRGEGEKRGARAGDASESISQDLSEVVILATRGNPPVNIKTGRTPSRIRSLEKGVMVAGEKILRGERSSDA